MVTTHKISTTNPHFTNILTLGLYTGNPQRRKVMDHEKQPLLPLDERFREAEQYALDLPATDQNRQKPPRPDVWVCIGNCNICPKCGNSNNRDWKEVIQILAAWNRHAKGRTIHPAFTILVKLLVAKTSSLHLLPGPLKWSIKYHYHLTSTGH